MSSNRLGNGIRKTSARPMKIHVDREGEHWYADVDDKGGFDLSSATPLSDSPHND